MFHNHHAPSNRTNHNNAYLRCLRGQVPVPTSGKERVLFQTIMVFFMVLCMVTFNWLIRQPDLTLKGFSSMLYEYPLTFCIALTVRLCVANPLVGRIVAHIPSTLDGVKRNLAITATNVGVMATIMTFFGTLISSGLEGFTAIAFITSVPLSVAAAFVVNYFVVGPLVKTIYACVVKPGLLSLAGKAATLKRTHATVSPTILSEHGK